MAKRNKVIRLLAGVSSPVIAAYNVESGFPKKTIMAAHRCTGCSTDLTVNKMAKPRCICCASADLELASPKTMTLTDENFKELEKLGECDNCGTGFVTNPETLAALAGENFNCPVCTNAVMAESSDDEDEDEDDSSANEEISENDYSGDSEDDSDNSDDGSTDEELENLIKSIQPDSEEESSEEDNSGEQDNSEENNSGEESTENKPAVAPPVVQENADDAGNEEEASEEGNSEENSNKDSEDEDEDEDVTASVYRALIKKAKNLKVVASDNSFSDWYLFADRSPVAIASFDKADESVKKVFRSHTFVQAFESAIADDGGLNEQIMKDFGFEPVTVNLEMDDVTKQIVEDAVNDKTADLNDKIANVAELYTQALGITTLGNIKGLGMFGNNNLRDALVAKLNSLAVRNADTIVDTIMANEMPKYITSVVVKANELMAKSTDSLNEIASMVKDAEFRTPTKAAPKTNVVLISVMSSVNEPENHDKGNLNGEREKPRTSVTASSIVSGIRRSANRNS